MKILCCGNSKFSAAVFQKLSEEYAIKIITKPGSDVVASFKSKCPVFELETLKNVNPVETVGEYDVIISCDFGLIIPPQFVKSARAFDVNLHTSLLPRHRGPAPIQWTIISGDHMAGITYIKIANTVDAGDIYAKYSFEIDDSTIYTDLRERLLELSCQTVLEVIHGIASGTVTCTPQQHHLATYAPKITKDHEMLKLDNSLTMLRWIHALSYTPGAYVVFRDKRLKLFRCKITEQVIEPGALVMSDGKLLLGGQDVALEILECQIEGKRIVSGKDFLNGYGKFLPVKVL